MLLACLLSCHNKRIKAGFSEGMNLLMPFDERTEKDSAGFVDSKKTNEWVLNKAGVEETAKHYQSKESSILWLHREETREKEIMQETMSGARRRGMPRTAWMDNIKTWTGMPVEVGGVIVSPSLSSLAADRRLLFASTGQSVYLPTTTSPLDVRRPRGATAAARRSGAQLGTDNQRPLDITRRPVPWRAQRPLSSTQGSAHPRRHRRLSAGRARLDGDVDSVGRT